jgi:glutaredoxin
MSKVNISRNKRSQVFVCKDRNCVYCKRAADYTNAINNNIAEIRDYINLNDTADEVYLTKVLVGMKAAYNPYAR